MPPMPKFGQSLLVNPDPLRGEVLGLINAVDDVLIQPFAPTVRLYRSM
jgi:hypothetical protein